MEYNKLPGLALDSEDITETEGNNINIDEVNLKNSCSYQGVSIFYHSYLINKSNMIVSLIRNMNAKFLLIMTDSMEDINKLTGNVLPKEIFISYKEMTKSKISSIKLAMNTKTPILIDSCMSFMRSNWFQDSKSIFHLDSQNRNLNLKILGSLGLSKTRIQDLKQISDFKPEFFVLNFDQILPIPTFNIYPMGKKIVKFKEYSLPIKIAEQMIINNGEHILYNNGEIEKTFKNESNIRRKNFYFKGFSNTNKSDDKFIQKFCRFLVENLSKSLNSESLSIYLFVDLESAEDIENYGNFEKELNSLFQEYHQIINFS